MIRKNWRDYLMSCSFIYDTPNSYTGFMSIVESYGIDMDIRTIDNLGNNIFCRLRWSF